MMIFFYYDLVFDVFFDDSKKRSESPNYYTLSQVDQEAEQNVFSLSENGNYFFSGNSVVICQQFSCVDTLIVNVRGEIVSAMEENDILLVLSVEDGSLLLSEIENNEVSRVDIVLKGNTLSNWSFLTSESFIGLISNNDNVDLVIVNVDGSIKTIDTVGVSTLKVVRNKELNFVSVQTIDTLLNFVCKGAHCKKVSVSKIFNEIWDMDVHKNGKTIFTFSDNQDITIVTCARFDCREMQTIQFQAPGVVSGLKVSYVKKNPTIVFSLEGGASGIANCIDSSCQSISLVRPSDYLSSSKFDFIKGSEALVLYANHKIQSFRNHLASPGNENCRATIAGNHAIENGEVFVCNSLPVPENYSKVFFWTPVVTSVFAQNL